jgi:hypothetical protein
MILDDFYHFTWTFPLRQKSDVLPTLIAFHGFVHTQFQCPIMCIQSDRGREFDNHASHSFFQSHDVVLHLTCRYTSQQNGRAEHSLHTLNDSMHTMLLHMSILTTFWPDALTTTTYLLNRRPCRLRHNATPFKLLLSHAPDYSHLCVFGLLCYPNTTTTSNHKLAPHSTPCIFIGYPAET